MRVDLPEDRPRLAVELDDGSEAILSPLAPDDRLLLVEGLAELSTESVYARFGHGRASLSEAELDYLSNIDMRRHVAWAAAVDGEGAGVGRYVVMDDPQCAEIAVTVLDRFQRRGLGTVLFGALASVAREEGVEEFCFEFVPGNDAVRRMVSGLDLRLDESGSAMMGRVSLADVPVDPRHESLIEVMRRARDWMGL